MGRKRSEWRGHVERWKSGILSRKEFCERHNLKLGTFHTWCARYKLLEEKNDSGLVEVMLKPESTTDRAERAEYPIEIATARGIRVGNDADGYLLSRILMSMGVR